MGRLTGGFALAGLLYTGFLVATPEAGWAGEPGRRTLDAFARFRSTRDAAQSARVNGGRSFLWAEESPARWRRVREGQVLAEPASGDGVHKVPDGLIVDWVGAVFIPGVSLATTLTVLHDYNNQKNIFKPELVDSKLLSRNGNEYRTYARIRKKAVITLVFDAEYDVHYFELGPTRWYSNSRSTRISEVENAGRPDERELPDGSGLLRKLDTYSRFEERDGGVYLECEAISLSRPLPGGLGWVFRPIVRNVCRSSLAQTLATTRDAVLRHDTEMRRASLQPGGEAAR